MNTAELVLEDNIELLEELLRLPQEEPDHDKTLRGCLATSNIGTSRRYTI
jgi:hypothetical protein